MSLCQFLRWTDICPFRGNREAPPFWPATHEVTWEKAPSDFLWREKDAGVLGVQEQGRALAEPLPLPLEDTTPCERRQEGLSQPIWATFPRSQHGFWTLIFLLIKTYIPACQESIPGLQLEFKQRSVLGTALLLEKCPTPGLDEAPLSWILGHFQQDLAHVLYSLRYFSLAFLAFFHHRIPLYMNIICHIIQLTHLLKLDCHSPVISLIILLYQD